MSVTVIGQHRVLKSRKVHQCFLCSVSIEKGEAHDSWACVDPGVSISKLRVHDACASYAHDCIEDWTSGDGVEDNAVETDLWERVVWREEGTWTYHVNEKEVGEILRIWPGLAAVMEKVRACVRRENKDNQEEDSP